MTITPPSSPAHPALASANSPIRATVPSAKSSPNRIASYIENSQLPERVNAAAAPELSKPQGRRPKKRGSPKSEPSSHEQSKRGSFRGPDRFIPDREIVMRQPGAAAYNTPQSKNSPTDGQLKYEARLAVALFGSPRNPYEYPILRKAPDVRRISHPVIPMNEGYTKSPEKLFELYGIMNDFYTMPAVYSESLDRLAVILHDQRFIDVSGAEGLGSQVYFYNFEDQNVSPLFPSDDLYSVLPSSVAMNETGTHVVLGLENGSVEVWSLRSTPYAKVFEMSPSSVLGKPGARINSLLVANHIILAGDQNGKLYRIDPKTCDIIEVPHSHNKVICNIVISPKGKYVATGGNDNKVIIREAHSLNKICELRMNAGIRGIVFSPECEERIAIGGGHADPRLAIYDFGGRSQKQWGSIFLDTQITNLLWEKNRIISTHCDGTYKVIPISFETKCPFGAVLSKKIGCGRILYAAIRENDKSKTLVCAGGNQVLELIPLPKKKPQRKVDESNLIDPFTRIR